MNEELFEKNEDSASSEVLKAEETGMHSLSDWSEILFRFILLYNRYIMTPIQYDFCTITSIVEIHTLSAIADRPGVTIHELATWYQRTDGAICQTVGKLEKKGYIVRKKENGNAKLVHLYVTPEGQKVSDIHKWKDAVAVSKIIGKLDEKFTKDEIMTFFKVVEGYNTFFLNE